MIKQFQCSKHRVFLTSIPSVSITRGNTDGVGYYVVRYVSNTRPLARYTYIIVMWQKLYFCAYTQYNICKFKKSYILRCIRKHAK